MTPAKQEKIAKSQVRGKLMEAENVSRLRYKYAHIGCPAARYEDNCPHPDDCAQNGRCKDLKPPFCKRTESLAGSDTWWDEPACLCENCEAWRRGDARCATPTHSDSPTQVRNG